MNIDCSIHMDPIVVGDEMVDRLKQNVCDIAKTIDSRIHIHDFRCVIGATQTNLIFDMEVPFVIATENQVLKEQMAQAVQKEMGDCYFIVTTIDRC